MHAIVHAADIQDRDGGALLMATLFSLYPFLLKLYADGGYQGAGFQNALRTILKRVNVEIVKRSDQAQRFVVLPKRWLVERTFAWLGRCRRLAKDWECLNRKALAFLKLLLFASFRGPARGRNPTLILSAIDADQQSLGQNTRNNHPGLAARERPDPTGPSMQDTDFPVYLPTLRQRMASRS